MKTAYELYDAVEDYMKRHGMKLKKSSFSHIEKYYKVTTMDYTELDAKLVECKNGRTMVVFKVDGKITSIKK